MDPSHQAYGTRGGVDRHDTTDLRPKERYLIDTYLRGRVLDIGCGTGRVTAHIAQTCEVVGVDYVEAMVRRAKQNYPRMDFRVMDVRRLEFPEASFDGAYFAFNGIDILYPLSDRLRALEEIHRVVKPGGIFAYVSLTDEVPPANSLRRIVSRAYGRLLGYAPPYYANFPGYGFIVTGHFSPDEQKRQLHDAGFELLEMFETKDVERMYITRRI